MCIYICVATVHFHAYKFSIVDFNFSMSKWKDYPSVLIQKTSPNKRKNSVQRQAGSGGRDRWWIGGPGVALVRSSMRWAKANAVVR